MKTHGEFVQWLRVNNPELLASWNKALSEFYQGEKE